MRKVAAVLALGATVMVTSLIPTAAPASAQPELYTCTKDNRTVVTPFQEVAAYLETERGYTCSPDPTPSS